MFLPDFLIDVPAFQDVPLVLVRNFHPVLQDVQVWVGLMLIMHYLLGERESTEALTNCDYMITYILVIGEMLQLQTPWRTCTSDLSSIRHNLIVVSISESPCHLRRTRADPETKDTSGTGRRRRYKIEQKFRINSPVQDPSGTNSRSRLRHHVRVAPRVVCPSH